MPEPWNLRWIAETLSEPGAAALLAIFLVWAFTRAWALRDEGGTCRLCRKLKRQ